MDELKKEINVYDRNGNDRFCPFCRYFVLYIDVVGQNTKLDGLQRKFCNPFETQKGFSLDVVEDFQDAFKDVWAIRRSFLDSFADSRKKYFERQQRTFDVVPQFVFASDGLFIWVKMSDDDFLDEPAALMIIMNAVATSQVILFSREIFFKAGACISYGIEHPDFKNDYYGPGLARVANLESKAPYPCILLDKNVIHLIRTYLKFAQDNKNQPLVEHCQSLLEYRGPEKKIDLEAGPIFADVFSPYKKFRRLKCNDYDDVMASLEKQAEREDLPEKIRKKYKSLLSDIHSFI